MVGTRGSRARRRWATITISVVALTSAATAAYSSSSPIVVQEPAPFDGLSFGWPVEVVGDVDGDGIVDFVANSFGYRANTTGLPLGAAHVVSGATGGIIHSLEHPEPSLAEQWAVRSNGVGDVTGDGIADIVVSDNSVEVGGVRSQGRAYLFSGSDGAFIRPLDVASPGGSARFGEDIVGLGDVNGNGTPDFVIGASSWKNSLDQRVGLLTLFEGSDGSVIRSWTAPTTPTGGFAWELAAVGDLTADGISEVATGSLGRTWAGFTGAGVVEVFDPTTGALVSTVAPPTLASGMSFGYDVAAAGDFDSDGTPDLVVSAGGFDATVTDQGRVYVISGADLSALKAFDDPDPSAPFTFGYPVEAAGDLNGDGITEIVVGDAWDTSDATSIGRVHVFDGATAAIIQTIPHPLGALDTAFGEEFAVLGDVNGDGHTEIAIGAYGDSFDGYEAAGRVYIVSIDVGDLAPPLVETPIIDPNPKATNQTASVTAATSDEGSGVTGGEYFIDTDPGPGNGVVMSLEGDELYGTIGDALQVGVYDVCVRAVDAAGLWSEPACTLFVIYDANGGFVTGGGWFISQAGAYIPDPTAAGKGRFGFVSKYKKGASVPTGNTEFQFSAADLNFRSDTYDWLVVTGGDYARFKGEGTINGEGEYKFHVWARDGDPDTFRIKIWTEDQPTGTEVIIYDNGLGQPLNGGSIVVHDKP